MSYRSNDYENLNPGQTYNYTVKISGINGGVNVTNLVTYTYPSLVGLNLTYDISNTTINSIRLKWTNYGYTFISFKNTTTNGPTTTYTMASNTTQYDSTGKDTLTPDTAYTYLVTLSNDHGDAVSQTITVYTLPTLAGLNVAYDVANSSFMSARFNWVNTGKYTSIVLKNTTLGGGSAAVTTYTAASGNTFYDSSGIDVLEASRTYTYSVTILGSFGNKNYTTVVVYTLPTFNGLNFVYNVGQSTASKIQFNWSAIPYTSIAIKNTTIAGSPTTTYTRSSGTAVFSSLGINTLAAGKTYVYLVTLTNDAGYTVSQSFNSYTIPSLSGLGMTYQSLLSSAMSVRMTWTNIGYTTITLQNMTLGNPQTSYTSSSGIVAYDSSGIETLTVDSAYTYAVTLSNDYGSQVSTTINAYTWPSLDGFNLTYINANSTTSSVFFTWVNTGVYTSVAIRNTTTSGTTTTYTSSSNTIVYNSSGIDSLASGKTYTYTVSVTGFHGGVATTTLKTYTLPSTTGLNLTQSSSNSGPTNIYFTWSNSVGYSVIGIQNTTKNGPTKYYTYSSGVFSYDSSGIDILVPNTFYTYAVTLYNDISNSAVTSISVTTIFDPPAITLQSAVYNKLVFILSNYPATVTSFNVSLSPNNGTIATINNGSTATVTITGLNTNVFYTFSASVTNSFGTSAAAIYTVTTPALSFKYSNYPYEAHTTRPNYGMRCSENGDVVISGGGFQNCYAISYDYGSSWYTSNVQLISAGYDVFAVSPNGKNMIIINAVATQVFTGYVSKDSGTTWSTINLPYSTRSYNFVYYELCPYISNDGCILISDWATAGISNYRYLQYSTDYGQSFNTIYSNATSTGIMCGANKTFSSPSSSAIVMIDMSVKNLNITYNFGQTWTTIDTNTNMNLSLLMSGDGNTIFGVYSTSYYVYKNNNGTWVKTTYSTLSTVGTSLNFRYNSISYDGTYMIFNNNSSTNLYYSTNSGENVSVAATGTASWRYISCIASNNKNIAYATSTGNICIGTTNFWQSYNQLGFVSRYCAVNNMATNTTNGCYGLVSSSDMTYIYIAEMANNSKRICRSTNSGVSFTVCPLLSYVPGGSTIFQAFAVACSKDGSIVYAAIRLNNATTPVTLYKSTDYGNSWSLLSNFNLWYLYPGAPLLCSSDGQIVVCYFYYSLDGGASFSRFPTNIAIENSASCMSYDGTYMYTYGNYNSINTVVKAIKSGTTYNLVTNSYSIGNTVSNMRCSSSGQYVYVGCYDSGQSKFFMSSNYGVNWTQIINPLPKQIITSFMDCSPDGSKIVLSASYQFGMLKSTDYASSWTYNIMPEPSGSYFEAMCISADGNQYLALTTCGTTGGSAQIITYC